MGIVPDRLLVELGADGRVSVGTWLDGKVPAAGEPFELAWPIGDDALEELRWYLEDYLRAPFGVYEERGPQVEARLPEWGSAVFSAVFGAGPAWDAYVRVRAQQRPVELVFRSASAEFLGLPWELMREPGRPAPLAMDLAGLSRSLSPPESAETVAVPGGRLRVLMVISRPAGTGDVGYQMIARPLLKRLEAVRGQVELMVLRPPTLEALEKKLTAAAEAAEPFQVVHFDGHGRPGGRRSSEAVAPVVSDGEGVLVFEQPGGGPDAVPASRVAQVLAMGQVPVVVLNACQSGAVGKDLEAAVATRLLRHGIASVVAMAYSVYAVAAADFMAAFYERLFAGHTVTAAVTAGRQRLFQRNMRPSPKGDMPLADWVVPVHYLRRDVSFPQARTERGAKASLDEELDRMRGPGSGDDALDLDPVGSFVGRDDLFYQLEVAAQQQKVVVLYGPGGTGKTELAKAFGRWWRDTRGVEQPDWVIWHSFEPGVASHGLDGVIMEIGLRVFGSDFASLARRERRAAAQQVLEERRLLLIWDNFETVHSMPAPGGAARPLGEAGREELREFLGQLTLRGRSAAVITSRTREGWLGDACRITVGRLATQEAAEYAGDLLTAYPAAGPRRARRAFGELMEWLDGHPLSMRLILPHLDTTEPEMLLDGLRGIAPLPDSDRAEEGRSTSLPASITYSFIHLADATRRLLPAVCLFQGVAAAMVLAAFSETPEVPARFRGATIQEWIASLEDAARVGLLAPLGLGMYQIHPALPAYLAAQWRCEEPEGYDSIRDAATRALLSAHASFGAWLEQEFRSGDAAMAVKTLDLQRYTFGRLFGFALDRQLWDEAHAIARPLILAWDARGRAEEVEAWADRVHYAMEGAGGNLPALDSPEGQLWLFVTGIQANHLATFRPKDAERIYPGPRQSRDHVVVMV